MNPQMQKFEHCFLQRVYHCPCLHLFVVECFNRGERSVDDIDCYLNEFDHRNILCKRIFSKIVGENMEHYLIVCETHLKTLLAAARKNTCTSYENNQTVSVEYTDKKEVFCSDYVRQYMMFMYFVFDFVQF